MTTKLVALGLVNLYVSISGLESKNGLVLDKYAFSESGT